MLKVAVLIACHNRRQITIRCLEKLYDACPNDWILEIYLVDDGSTDGTAEAVKNFDMGINLLVGDGSWYWAYSMHYAEASIDKPCDAILWVNDDIELYPDSLKRVSELHKKHLNSILVGQFCETNSNKITYGGLKKYDRHPLHFEQVFSFNEPNCVDTFNGNFVFIPKNLADMIGPIDGQFGHAYADIDYGLRARRLDISLLVIPGFLGTCDKIPQIEPSRRISKFRYLTSVKNLPPKSQYRFLRRHGNWTWPVYFIFPYIKVFFNR